MTAAKTATTKSPVAAKKKTPSKADKPGTGADKSQSVVKLGSSSTSSFDTTVDPVLTEKAVRALLKYHEKTIGESDKHSLLGNDRPLTVQFTLLRAPTANRPKPIPIVVPHPFFKTFDDSSKGNEKNNNNDDDDDTATEEPEICLIVKEESKPWCQEMIAKFPDYMGGIKKVLGLDSLRKKHCNTYEQRRQLLHKYNMFLADDRILPMLSKLLGKAFIESKRLPVPIDITREKALPFAIQKALSSTYMTLNKGTCVSVRVGHTGMKLEHLVANVLAVCDGSAGAIPKLPRKWANVQMIGLKTADSTLLPIYNQTPEALKEIAKMAGLNDVAVVKITTSSSDKKKTKTSQQKNDNDKSTAKEDSKKRELKSPLLKALKKQKREEETKEAPSKPSSAKKNQEEKELKSSGGSATKKSKKSKVVDETNDVVENKEKKSKSPKAKASTEIITTKESSKNEKNQSKSPKEKVLTGTVAEESPKDEKKHFVASKKFKGTKKGYVFRMGPSGLGYYVDVKPVVNPMAIDAIKKMSKGRSNGKKRGGSKNNKYKGTRRF